MSSPIIEVLSNKGKKWSTEQDTLLKTQYVDNEMNIIDIAKIHKRTVGSIICRLKGIGEIPNYIQSDQYEDIVRGYTEYLQDEEFIKLEKLSKNKKENPLPPSLLNPSRDTEITEIKNSIREMKSSIREILLFLHSIYELEQEE